MSPPYASTPPSRMIYVLPDGYWWVVWEGPFETLLLEPARTFREIQQILHATRS